MHFFFRVEGHVIKQPFLKLNGGWNAETYRRRIYDCSSRGSSDGSVCLIANHCIVHSFTHTFTLKDLSHLPAILGHCY